MILKKVRHIFGSTIEQRGNSMGLVFILPWMIGLIWFFLYPMVQAVFYIWNRVELETGGIRYHFVGMEMIDKVVNQDPNNVRILVSSLRTTFVNAVLIVVFSMIVAVLLNKPFRGRGFCRAIVALPIIVSSGILMQIFQQDLFRQSIESGAAATVFQGAVLQDTLLKMGLNDQIVNTLSTMVANILDLIWLSGIQILLFIAGMQAIPKMYMEVCEVEGATAWQSFWRVTFPMLTPFLLVNFVYAIIDSFTLSTNPVIGKINDYFKTMQYSEGTSLSMIYFVVALIVVGIVTAALSRHVFYMEK